MQQELERVRLGDILSNEFEKLKPSIDTTIDKIPDGKFRAKIIGTIVSHSESAIVVNDGTGQISISTTSFDPSTFSVTDFGRYVISTTKENDNFYGILVAFHKLTKQELRQYQRLLKLERRIPK
jgi:hypothetical protein